MDNEVVSNTAGTGMPSAALPSAGGNAELAAIMAEFKKVEEDFGVNLMSRLSSRAEHDALDQAIKGTVFSSAGAESGGMLSLLDIADGKGFNGQEGVLDVLNPVVNAIKLRAQKIIAMIVKLVRKGAKYAPCIPQVTAAVAAFSAQQYGSALTAAMSAFACIQSKG
jgi:hypothetical protein